MGSMHSAQTSFNACFAIGVSLDVFNPAALIFRTDSLPAGCHRRTWRGVFLLSLGITYSIEMPRAGSLLTGTSNTPWATS